MLFLSLSLSSQSRLTHEFKPFLFAQFLAYYGVLSRNTSLLDEAYNQIRLYRQYLRDPITGLWRHILLGSNQDNGLWSTGSFRSLTFAQREREKLMSS